MPVYEYECAACGHQFEEWQKINDQPVKTCPKCQADKVERLISQTAFHLKGGGWYSDLYSSKGKGSSSGSSSSEGGSGSGSSSGESSKASGGDKPSSDKPAKPEAPKETPKPPKDKGKGSAAA